MAIMSFKKETANVILFLQIYSTFFEYFSLFRRLIEYQHN